MIRVVGGVVAAVLVCAVVLNGTASQSAAGEGTEPTFVPQLTPAPSPTQVTTALPPPISRPEDARGIGQTTPPLRVPATYSPPPLQPVLWGSTTGSFVVPCTLHADRIFVPVVVNGQPATFLLASNAPFSSIDPSVTTSRDSPITLNTLQIGELRFNQVRASVNRMSAYARTYLGARADGILGQELFAHYPVKIDYRNCSVTVFRDGATARADAPKTARTLPLRVSDGVPMVGAVLDGLDENRFAVDTASDAEVDVRRALVPTRLTLLDFMPELRRVEPAGELAGETARVRSLVLGDIVVDHPLVGIISSADGTTRASRAAGAIGALGNGVLERFVVLFDEPEGVLLLDTVAATRRPYDRSGAWLVLRTEGITVRSVLPNSPAAKAQLHGGDVVVAFNGQPVSDLDAARAVLAGAPGTAITVGFLRAGHRYSAVVTLRNLIL